MREHYEAHRPIKWWIDVWYMWQPHSILIRAWEYQVKLSWSKSGRFSNGSWWHSPIHRWRDEPDW